MYDTNSQLKSTYSFRGVLREAVRLNAPSTVIERLCSTSSSSNVREIDDEGCTPLHFVSCKEITCILVNKGAEINARNNENSTPLLKICCDKTPSLELIEFLLESGANVKAKDQHGNTALHHCRSIEIADLLLKHGADINARSHLLLTVLSSTCRNGEASPSYVEFLLQNGADVHTIDMFGNTALHDCRSIEIAEILLKRGAEINTRSNLGFSMLSDICRGNTPSLEYLEFLLKNGANLSFNDMDGSTPLHHAKSIETVKLFLKHNAEVDAQDSFGRTVLMLICSKGEKFVDLIEFLLENNASVHMKDRHSMTPLHHGLDVPIAKILLSRGAEIDAKDELGYTPLMRVCSKANLYMDLVQFFLRRGASVTSKNVYGDVLMRSCNSRKIGLLGLNHGAEMPVKQHEFDGFFNAPEYGERLEFFEKRKQMNRERTQQALATFCVGIQKLPMIFESWNDSCGHDGQDELKKIVGKFLVELNELTPFDLRLFDLKEDYSKVE